MAVEQLEETCVEYEGIIKRLDKENRELKTKIKDYENIVFALKSILGIADNL